MPKKKETVVEESTNQVEETIKEAEVKVEEPTVTLLTGAKVKCVDIFRDALMDTKREGMSEFLDYVASLGFLDAPCSGGNHLCKKGGLLEHSVNVFLNAERIGLALYGEEKYQEIKDSIAIAALLHDLGKCGDYGKKMYVENILKSGKVSDAKPFKRNPDLSAVPHAIRSVKLATLYLDLTEDEEWAILCHDGLYDFMKYDMQNKETPLSMIIHWADMWASRVTEGGSDEKDGDQ